MAAMKINVVNISCSCEGELKPTTSHLGCFRVVYELCDGHEKVAEAVFS